jgi:hypothetical protein
VFVGCFFELGSVSSVQTSTFVILEFIEVFVTVEGAHRSLAELGVSEVIFIGFCLQVLVGHSLECILTI